MTTVPERAAPGNVIAALARVTEELPGIGRNERSEQGYNYRGIEAITREAQGLFGKYGVVFVPRVLHREVKPLTINGKPWTQDEAEIVYRVYGPGGPADFIEVGPLFGLARDNSDKGMNKAMTQAFKYALIQTLCIGDAKDDVDAGPANESDAPPEVFTAHCVKCGLVCESGESKEAVIGDLRVHMVDEHGWVRNDDGTVQAPPAPDGDTPEPAAGAQPPASEVDEQLSARDQATLKDAPPDALSAIIDAVQELSQADVDAELKAQGRRLSGSQAFRRRKLVVQRIANLAEAEQ